jgi:hypothetical protein
MRRVDLIVRVEWAAVAVAAIVLYGLTGVSWWLFALLILAPDLSMIGYLAGPHAGAAAYNAVHFLAFPVFLALFGVWLGHSPAIAVALVWIAHISVDRMLGYGLKLPTDFRDTHLGRIGRDISP